jgi:short-subunit dehydrogenase
MNQVRNYSNKERISVVTGSRKGIGKVIAMEFANMLSMTRNMMIV